MRNAWTRLVELAAAVCCVLGGISARGETTLGHRYEIVPWTQGWTAAKADAEARGGHLATITSEAECSAIYELFGNDLLGCWLGGTDAGEEGAWRWVTGEKWGYTRWADTEPDNYQENQHYLAIHPDYNRQWDDLANNRVLITKYLLEYGVFNTDISITTAGKTFGKEGGSASILTDGNGVWSAWTDEDWITLLQGSGSAGSACIFQVKVNLTGETRTGTIYIEDQAFHVAQLAEPLQIPERRYEIIPWTNGWIAAEADAEARGGHLATITSEAEWVTVSNLFGGNFTNCWLGGTDEAQEGVWKWVTGEKWEYTMWRSGEPNNSLANDTINGEDYLVLYPSTLWNDLDATNSVVQAYLLEYENVHNTNITITAIGRTFDKAGGAASVITGGSGEWSAWTDSAWITLNRANGEAGVSCIYAVGANFSAGTRIGRIYIEDKVFTVTQTGYEGTISPEGAEWDCAGGTGEIAVTVDAGVAWTAVANVDWITVEPRSGRSSGKVEYRVAAYDETPTRSGSITVAGQSFAVTQTGVDVTLSPMEKTLDWRANAFEVIVGALATTQWTPVPEASWLSVVDSGHGYGDSAILVAVGENPSAASRTGTVAVGSKRVTVTQLGTADLTLELTPREATASAVGAYGNIAVYGTPDAAWEAVPSVEWITISSGATGAGNGNIKYIVMANPLLTEREGTIKVTMVPGSGGGTGLEAVHRVRQGVIDPVVAPTEVSFRASGGSTNVQLTVADNTQWTAESPDSWIKVTSASSSAGSAKVWFDAAPNPSTEGRTGTLVIAGKTVTVAQAGLWSRLNYDGTVFGTKSDSGFIDVQVEGDGTWTASTDASWLTLLDTGGHGSASVMFVVDDFNTAVASRTAVVTIAGKTVEITQRGYELSIDPAVAELASNAGAGEIGISAPIDALWEAIVTVDWIRLVGETTGLGNGTLRYTVTDNTSGDLRTGKIIISGQEYTVTQHANLTLTTRVEGAGTVTGAGDYETNERATLVATPDEGYAFTHWSGDAVGVEPQVTIVMDMNKTVTAHFIPEDAAERLAAEKAAQGGFYTREQMKALAMGDTVIEVDPEDGAIDLAIQLQESADLSGGDWSGVDAGDGSVTVDGEGRVHIKMAPKGNTAFYRLVNGGAE